MRQKSKPDEMSAATRAPKVMPFHKTLTNLPPAYFAMFLVRGILALACQLEKIPTLPGILFAINLAAYLILWALTILRIRYHPQRFLGDFGSHPRGPGFFTMVAATSVLGAQFAVQMQMAAAAQLLWWFAFALWLVLTYTIFTALTIRISAPAVSRAHDDDLIGAFGAHRLPALASASVLVTNQATGEVLLEKNAESVVPIASITKLMTAMVVLDGQQSLAETVRVTEEDIDTLKGSSSRLPVGTELPRDEMLRLALMASENRAASSLARNYPGGPPALLAAMNRKAAAIGLSDTHFRDSTGLNFNNVSSARDLAKMVAAASRYPLIREFSTTAEHEVEVGGRVRRFGNTNALVKMKSPEWEIGLSKTGYISEAGRCLVMQAWL